MENLKEKLNKKVLLILLIAVVVIATIISTVFIVRNASAKKAQASSNDKASYSNTEGTNKSTSSKTVNNTTTEIVTNKEGETFQVVTDKSGVTQTIPMQNGTTKPNAQSVTTKPSTKESSKPVTNKPSTGTGNSTNTTTTKPDNNLNAPITTPGFESLSSENARKIQTLKNDTGVLIQTGVDANMWYAQEQRYGETDQSRIAQWVNEIDEQVRRYPKGFFREINPSGIVEVAIISYINGDLAGFASYEIGTNLSIGLDSSMYDDLTSKRTFNHEVMHLIEKHVEFESGQSDPMAGTWNFIPLSAINSGLDEYLVYDTTKDITQRYFVTNYAKSNARDDRAETFADYMFRPFQKDYMMNPNYPMPKKMAIIAKQIRSYFVTARNAPAGSLPWEKLL